MHRLWTKQWASSPDDENACKKSRSTWSRNLV